MPPRLLRFGNDMLAEGGLAGRFGAVDLDHPPTRYAADTERNIQGQRAGWDGFNLQVLGIAQAHDGAFAILLGQHVQRLVQSGRTAVAFDIRHFS